jgi:hypothetical protein
MTRPVQVHMTRDVVSGILSNTLVIGDSSRGLRGKRAREMRRPIRKTATFCHHHVRVWCGLLSEWWM